MLAASTCTQLTYIPYLRHACVAWNDASDLEYRYISYVHVRSGRSGTYLGKVGTLYIQDYLKRAEGCLPTQNGRRRSNAYKPVIGIAMMM